MNWELIAQAASAMLALVTATATIIRLRRNPHEPRRELRGDLEILRLHKELHLPTNDIERVVNQRRSEIYPPLPKPPSLLYMIAVNALAVIVGLLLLAFGFSNFKSGSYIWGGVLMLWGFSATTFIFGSFVEWKEWREEAQNDA